MLDASILISLALILLVVIRVGVSITRIGNYIEELEDSIVDLKHDFVEEIREISHKE